MHAPNLFLSNAIPSSCDRFDGVCQMPVYEPHVCQLQVGFGKFTTIHNELFFFVEDILVVFSAPFEVLNGARTSQITRHGSPTSARLP